jgi:hypothetical protein
VNAIAFVGERVIGEQFMMFILYGRSIQAISSETLPTFSSLNASPLLRVTHKSKSSMGWKQQAVE